MLELALTRIFSVVFYYHFAFLAISIALFGLGAGGVFSYLVAGRPGTVYWKLGTLALANSLCVVASLWFVLSLTGDLQAPQLAAVYLISALPFFLAGAIVSLRSLKRSNAWIAPTFSISPALPSGACC